MFILLAICRNDIITSVFQVFESIPATSDPVPIVGKVFMCILFICGVTLVMTCVILVVSFKTGSSAKDVPWWVRFINAYVASVLCIDGEQKRIWRWLQTRLNSLKDESQIAVSRDHEIYEWNEKSLIPEKRACNHQQPIRKKKVSYDLGSLGVVEADRSHMTSSTNESDLSFLREKYEREESEKQCSDEYDKCVRVLDRLSLIVVMVVFFLALYALLSQPEHFWVP